MLTLPELVAVSGFLVSLKGSNLPIRRPSYNRPTFWSRPLQPTRFRPIPAGTDWIDYITVTGLKQYIAVVDRYVATSFGDFVIAGLEFRFLLNGNLLTGVDLAPGVELNKDGPNTYPVIPRRMNQSVLEGQQLTLQVRNLTGLQRSAIGALYGWYYDAIDSTVIGTADSAGVSDAVYTPLVGRPY